MKYLATCTVFIAVLFTAGCSLPGMGSGADRTALARTTIQQYWSEVAHGQLTKAYSALSGGVRGNLPQNQYAQNMIGLLTRAGSLAVQVRSTSVSGDNATVGIKLLSPKSTPLIGWQHLFWEDGGWHISDNNAFIATHP